MSKYGAFPGPNAVKYRSERIFRIWTFFTQWIRPTLYSSRPITVQIFCTLTMAILIIMMTALYAEIIHKSILYHYGLVTVKIGFTVFSIVFAAIDLFSVVSIHDVYLLLTFLNSLIRCIFRTFSNVLDGVLLRIAVNYFH